MRRTLCALALAVVVLPPAAAQSPSPGGPLEAGPLRFRDQFLLSLGFLAFEPTSAVVTPSGEWQLEVIFTTANTWAPSAPLEIELDARDERQPVTIEQLDRLTGVSKDGGLVFVDGEVSRTVLTLRRGFGRGVQLELDIPLLRLSGGSLDGGVESFHDALGIEQAGRPGAPKDQLFVFLDTRRGEFTQQGSSSLQLGDLVLSVKVALLDDQRAPLGLAIEGLVKVPTGADEPLLSSGKADFGAQLLAGHRHGKWSFHGSLGALRLGASERLGLGSQTLFAGMAGVERRFGDRTSLVLQGSVAQSPFEELATSRIGERSVQFTLGAKRALGRNNLLLFGFTENLENFNNSADVNLHLGFRRTLD